MLSLEKNDNQRSRYLVDQVGVTPLSTGCQTALHTRECKLRIQLNTSHKLYWSN